MKSKFIPIVFLPLLICACQVHTVSYTYKPLAEKGCHMKYSVSKQDTAYYIVATITSDNLGFLKDPIMLIKNFDGEVAKLYGSHIWSNSESYGLPFHNFILPLTEYSATAQFKITPEQFEVLKRGVSKVRLSTTPIQHEREFKKDKIGKKLYQFYLKQRDKGNDF